MTTPGPRYAELLADLDRARSSGVLLGLERTRAALGRLGNPQRRAATVQIAGTNGKGSTAAMTDAILRAAGLRTGLYTSPHLSRFTERIRVDGVEADGDRLARLNQQVAATGIPLTYFEIATVLAFMTFAESGVDVVVAETGLGGRLDATTTSEPVATAITSIDWDHADVLGSTLAEIAAEKAGIAKRDVPLFLAPVAAEADAAIAATAERVGARVRRLGVDFQPWAASPALLGAHQTTNAAIAVELARAAAMAVGKNLDDRAIESGLRDVRWPGRLEWVADDLLLDCAHNTEGAVALAAALDRLPRGRRRVLLFAVVGGKPAAAMLSVLGPRFDAVFVTQSSNSRAVPAEALRAMVFATAGVDAAAIADPLLALTAARAAAGVDGFVVGAGSTFLVGDVRAAVLGESRDPIPTSDPVAAMSP